MGPREGIFVGGGKEVLQINVNEKVESSFNELEIREIMIKAVRGNF